MLQEKTLCDTGTETAKGRATCQMYSKKMSKATFVRTVIGLVTKITILYGQYSIFPESCYSEK